MMLKKELSRNDQSKTTQSFTESHKKKPTRVKELSKTIKDVKTKLASRFVDTVRMVSKAQI